MISGNSIKITVGNGDGEEQQVMVELLGRQVKVMLISQIA